jgi:hypothetical protein
MKSTRENRSTRGKACPSATVSTTNATWTDPGSNTGLRGERPATNRLSHATTNPTWTDPGSNTGLRGGRPATNRLSHGTAYLHDAFV